MNERESERPGSTASVYLSRDDAINAFAGEWVIMKVAERDSSGWPSYGQILAHSPERANITAVLAQEPPRSGQASDATYYVFRAYPRVRSDSDYDQRLEQLAHDMNVALGAGGARQHR